MHTGGQVPLLLTHRALLQEQMRLENMTAEPLRGAIVFGFEMLYEQTHHFDQVVRESSRLPIGRVVLDALPPRWDTWRSTISRASSRRFVAALFGGDHAGAKSVRWASGAQEGSIRNSIRFRACKSIDSRHAFAAWRSPLRSAPFSAFGMAAS
jgi:hypothetical protein